VPESRAPRARAADPVGQVLVIITLAALVYGIIEGPARGWTSPVILGCFVVSLAALAALIRYEPRRPEPLIDLRFFRSIPFSGATLIAICAFAALGGFLLLSTLFLQNVRGYSALHAGLFMVPLAAMTMVCAPLSGRIVGARGPRLPLIVAGTAITAAGLMLTRLTAHTSPLWLIAAFIVFGIGFGAVNAPITNTAVSGMPRAQAGVAAAVASTSRQVGQSLGVAIIGSAVVSALAGSFRLGFPAATHAGWWIICGCGVTVLAIGLASTSPWARATAARTAEQLMPAGEAAGAGAVPPVVPARAP
jgi:predicted MFS family arabinose efflux permease